ncbi:MAG: glycerol-3-phosphate 1-O-acyltransferase PlsY [Gammaproteobacteria bacterium]|nr:glycerol-3-phosphate 1-O-acyltransferase PlsY [Gammaproteobacteria bacterium]
MLELGLKILVAYLLGALVGSLVLGRLRGVDIRAMGSGNAGATNAFRTQGKAFGLAVFVIDVAKGVLAVTWLPIVPLPAPWHDPTLSPTWIDLGCGLAVVVGHVFPVWFDFRGGKGAATMIGVLAGLAPRLLAPTVIAWCLVVALSGFVGLATMLAGAAATVAAAFLGAGDWRLPGFCATLTVFLVYTHRANIARMRVGTEHRARRLWLLRPRST